MADVPNCPRGREEEYLSDIAGLTDNAPDKPWSRKEAYLNAINEHVEGIEQEVEDLKNNPDVVDIVDTYADLQAYDTSNLGDKDIIRVLNDETHNNESTYYRYSKASDSWTYIGSTGPKGGEQSDWAENDSEDPAYIKNRPFYSETVESTIPQGQSQNVGNTPDSGYVWFAEQVQDYALHTVLADFEDGDTVLMTVSYSVGETVKSDTGKFILTIENDEAFLDSDMPVTSRWNGGYASESSGDTTFRWPVATADASQTIYLTKVEYEKVKQIDAKYLPDTGSSVNVVQATGTSTTDVMSQNAVSSMVFADPGDDKQVQIGEGASVSYQTTSGSRGAIAIGQNATATADRAIAIGNARVSEGTTASALGGIAIGSGAKSKGTFSVSVGQDSNSDSRASFIGSYAVSIGPQAEGRQNGVAIGYNAKHTSATGWASVVVGANAKDTAGNGVAIGGGGDSSSAASVNGAGGVAIGARASAVYGAVALGYGASATTTGEMNIGSSGTNYGYNSSNYRLLTGVYDPQSAHDAATKGYVDGLVGNISTTLQTLISGTGATGA